MAAIDYVPHGRLAIASGSTLRVDDAKGMLLYVWHGPVWLTQERDQRDHLLESGESFRIDRAGAVVSLTTPQPQERASVFPMPVFALR